jgi:Protein of unknown function (DUF2591)
MKKNICELDTEEISFAVAHLEKITVDDDGCIFNMYEDCEGVWSPCFHWSQSGPIIDREKITVMTVGNNWVASIKKEEEIFGPTPLIAAMRCYVASKLGGEVDMEEIFEALQLRKETIIQASEKCLSFNGLVSDAKNFVTEVRGTYNRAGEDMPKVLNDFIFNIEAELQFEGVLDKDFNVIK